MDNNMIKDNFEDNSKVNSLVNDLVVAWEWNKDHNAREFLDLRYGGDRENRYELQKRFDNSPSEDEQVLISSDKLMDFSREEIINKVVELLNGPEWMWSNNPLPDFRKIAENVIK